MPKLSCFVILIQDNVDTFHRSECTIAQAQEGREAGFLDNVTLAAAIVIWVNGVLNDGLKPNHLGFCQQCEPQAED